MTDWLDRSEARLKERLDRHEISLEQYNSILDDLWEEDKKYADFNFGDGEL